MLIAKTIAECRMQRRQLGKLALVPTMGALHSGHLSLIQAARKYAPHVAVSIFVNPTQFGAKEDFHKYPRPIEADLAKCQSAGVDMVFDPSAEEMYPANHPEISVDLPNLSGVLEGRFRPGHFKGVCQVVAKLFNIFQPDAACFGQKDYQQFRILSAMVQALNWPIEIVRCPTIRDPDGLALSSRNQYLSPPERQRALSISKALFTAQEEFSKGVRQTNRLITTMQNILLSGGEQGRVPLQIDYVAAVDAISLKNVDTVTEPAVLAIAARVGKTRLIDNILLIP
ncbi:MAG: pantoate--beta-alanine ligase [Tepidisphaeraceae bacterium]|jgi:pantoate--beta-alanine ligase